jgi:TolB-like protein/class 3 adenylate cyclase
MEKDQLSRKLAVILHADVVGSTSLVHQSETLAHQRIHAAFIKLSAVINTYNGSTCELRGDALIAEFERASDAVSAALSFQESNKRTNEATDDTIVPRLRIGISLGEVVIADDTITGAGVVLAQRIEQLCNPDGVCITGALHEAIPKHLPFVLESLGKKSLKGFDDQIEVYEACLNSDESIPPPEKIDDAEQPRKKSALTVIGIVALIVVALALWFHPWKSDVVEETDKTENETDKGNSIAVLPFDNMSDGKEQEYFADGMAEDLITDLSKISGLFVIARNSSFAYKNKVANIQEVAANLDVRYVVEGSVRRFDNQVRVNVQLIDSSTGGHVWAERYDGTYDDVFALQDKITSNIVASLAIRLTEGDQERLSRNETDSTQAYDAFLKGWEQYLRQTPKSFRQAITLFEQSVKLDPQYSRAYAALSATYWHTWKNYLIDKSEYVTPPHQFRYDAENYLAKAMENPTPLALQISSAMHAQFGRHEQSIEEGERAIALDPNAPDGYVALAGARNLAGQPEKALTLMERAMRLNPHYPPSYLQELALARFSLENFENAAIVLQRLVTLNPDDRSASRLLIATLGHLGRIQEVKTIIDRMDSSVAFDLLSVRSIAYWYPFKNPADAERLAQGLRKAGLPD